MWLKANAKVKVLIIQEAAILLYARFVEHQATIKKSRSLCRKNRRNISVTESILQKPLDGRKSGSTNSATKIAARCSQATSWLPAIISGCTLDTTSSWKSTTTTCGELTLTKVSQQHRRHGFPEAIIRVSLLASAPENKHWLVAVPYIDA